MNRKITCEECQKEIKRKESLGIHINGKIQPFYCCSYECLGLYINKLANIVDGF
jgi:hypothetical protein